ncbi:MAG: MopE-related protein [Pseudomonadota bacterium]
MTVRKVRCAVSLLAGALAALGAGGSVRAQSLRPHVLFIFDTSGSMRENAAGTNVGEGTNLCTAGTTSRIYSLKNALRASLAQAGTDEANFGLMSFAQTTTNTLAGGSCSTGHYRAAASRTAIATPNRATPDYPSGCLMSSNSIETTFGPWFNTGVAEVLRVGVTTAAPGVTPTAANYDPPDANIPAIYRWLDNVELPAANGAVTDPELHADGNTPLGRSLFYAKMYYDGVVKPNDPKSSCRKNAVVLVTDGAETCDDATAPDPMMFNLTTCSGGAAFNPFHPVVQACQLFRTSGIRTYMITDNALSAGDLAAADRIAAAGGTAAAIRVSLADSNAAKAALVGIIAETVPPTEICNGLDENCNGQIDEGVKNNCPLDLSATLKHCAVETANCLDDDCDGMIDEGFPLNACGQSAACPIPPELCDGLDNDCDGDIDEGFNVGASCNNGLTGTCRRVGITECAPDKMSVTCNLTGAPTAPEVCNGIDDDCNGMVDDGLGTGQGVGVDCGIQGQGCNKGITRCIAGKIVCEGSSQPTMETCNGRDDDCNGLVDDGTFPGIGDSCLCPPLTMAQAGVGQCRAGRIVCRGTSGLQCEGCVLPQPEICNGKDDDCDGMPDQMAMCPSGFGCREGSCGLLCRPGEFRCPQGYDCVDPYCVPNRCRNVQCTIDQKCDNDTGSCVDLCFKITCLAGQTCLRGNCYDCSNNPALACAPGQLCVNRQCVTDKCAGVQCADGAYCAAGKCISLNCDSACATNQACVAGQCREDKCRTVLCDNVEYCEQETGTCKPNMCLVKTCPFCAPATGECTPDPCANIKCSQNGCYTCQVTEKGQPYCKASDSCGNVRTVAGSKGGGCSCTVGAEPSSPWSSGAAALALFGLTVLARRRRRRR